MIQADSLRPLNVLLMSGPELTGAGIDPQDFSQAVASLPNCRVLSMDTTQPTAAQEEQLRTFLGRDQELQSGAPGGQRPGVSGGRGGPPLAGMSWD